MFLNILLLLVSSYLARLSMSTFSINASSEVFIYSNLDFDTAGWCPFTVSSGNLNGIYVQVTNNFGSDANVLCISKWGLGLYNFWDCIPSSLSFSVQEYCKVIFQSVRFDGLYIASRRDQGVKFMNSSYSLTFTDGTSSQEMHQSVILSLASASSNWVPWLGQVNPVSRTFFACRADAFVTSVYGQFYGGTNTPGTYTYMTSLKMKCSDNSVTSITDPRVESSEKTFANCPSGLDGMSLNMIAKEPGGIRFKCGSLVTAWFGNSTEAGSYNCPSGSIITGFYTGWGTVLDGIGVECSTANFTVSSPVNISLSATLTGSTLIPPKIFSASIGFKQFDNLKVSLALGSESGLALNYSFSFGDYIYKNNSFTMNKLMAKRVYIRFYGDTMFDIAASSDIYINITVETSLANVDDVQINRIPFQFSNQMEILRSKQSKQSTTSVISSFSIEDSTSINMTVLLTSALVSLFFAVSVAAIFYKRWLKTRANLIVGSQSNSVAISVLRAQKEMTLTLNLTNKEMAFIPGYLAMNLDEDIIFDKGANNVIGEGGTAYIMTAKLRSSLIAKHRCSSVAVKIMTESSESCSKDFTDSFLYEVALMNSLPKSPNIVHFIGYSTQPLMTLVMKLYSTSLKTLLARQELFENDAEILLKIAHDICNGMKQIHSYGILHLDLKPSKRHNITDGYGLTVDVDNVLVDIMGDMSFNCVICDFGFASFIGESDKLVSGLRTPTTNGITIRYAAPEMLEKISSATERFNKESDKKIDVYAYAIVLYEMITRKAAWNNLPQTAIMYKVKSGRTPSLTLIEDDNENDGLGGNDMKKIEWHECFTRNRGLTEIMLRSWYPDPAARMTFQEIYNQLLKISNVNAPVNQDIYKTFTVSNTTASSLPSLGSDK